MNREPVTIEPRRPLTRRETIELAVAQLGKCGCGCGVKLDALREGVTDEHRIPLAQGGTNALTNRELWRTPCAVKKTKKDAGDIAKARRIEARENGTRRERQPIPQHVNGLQSRGFDATKSRGLDGQVRPRTTKGSSQ